MLRVLGSVLMSAWLAGCAAVCSGVWLGERALDSIAAGVLMALIAWIVGLCWLWAQPQLGRASLKLACISLVLLALGVWGIQA